MDPGLFEAIHNNAIFVLPFYKMFLAGPTALPSAMELKKQVDMLVGQQTFMLSSFSQVYKVKMLDISICERLCCENIICVKTAVGFQHIYDLSFCLLDKGSFGL